MTGAVTSPAARFSLLAAGLGSTLTAYLGGILSPSATLLASVFYVAAVVLATTCDIRRATRRQRLLAAGLPGAFLVLVVAGSAFLDSQWAVLLLTAMIGQATLTRSRTDFVTAVGLAGMLLVWTAVRANTAAMGLSLTLAWLMVIAAAMVINACAGEPTPGVRVRVSDRGGRLRLLRYGATTAVISVALGAGLLLLVPQPLSMLLRPPRVRSSTADTPSPPPLDSSGGTPSDWSFPTWLDHWAVRLVMLLALVALVVVLLRQTPERVERWRKSRKPGSKSASDGGTARDLESEPLAAFRRLEHELAESDEPRAPAETPIELSLRLPGPPFRALATVEQTCYALRAPSEVQRAEAARALDATAAQVQAKRPPSRSLSRWRKRNSSAPD